ncbi:MAG: hypothetical protein ACLT98_08445 [Eggerthellaceae bacterium]
MIEDELVRLVGLRAMQGFLPRAYAAVAAGRPHGGGEIPSKTSSSCLSAFLPVPNSRRGA